MNTPSNTDIFGDDFDDGFDKVEVDHSKARGKIVNLDADKDAKDNFGTAKIKAQFVENCPDCGGRGQFVSWSGRIVGPCFKCKGKGKVTHRQPLAVREKQRQQRADRKAKEAQSNLDAFAEAHPDVWAWIDGNTFEFAVAMKQAIEKFGHLTDKQLSASRKCAEKFAAAKAAQQSRIDAAVEVDLSKISDAFQTAKANGLKWPKVRFAGLTISIAGENSRHPGSLNIKADGNWIGRVLQGKFIRGRDCTDELEKRVVETCKDPKAAAIAFGVQTGSCACCGRELTNEESVAAGIGPICAEKFGW